MLINANVELTQNSTQEHSNITLFTTDQSLVTEGSYLCLRRYRLPRMVDLYVFIVVRFIARGFTTNVASEGPHTTMDFHMLR